MTEEEINKIVREAVSETLFGLGLKVTEEEDIEEARKDLTYLRRWRKSADKLQSIGLATAFAIIVTGLMGALFAGFLTWLK